MYTDALHTAAETLDKPRRYGKHRHRRRRPTPGLHECGGWPVLRRALALLHLDGIDPADALHRAADRGAGLADAADPAAVLTWRLPTAPSTATGPLHWLDPTPRAPRRTPGGGSLPGRPRPPRRTELADHVRATTTTWTAATMPAWARPVSTHPRLLAELAAFRAAHDVDPADTRITGAPQYPARSAAVQHALRSAWTPPCTPATRPPPAGVPPPPPPTPASPPTRSGRNWPPTSTTPPAPEPTSKPCSPTPWPAADRCPTNCPPPPSGGAW